MAGEEARGRGRRLAPMVLAAIALVLGGALTVTGAHADAGRALISLEDSETANTIAAARREIAAGDVRVGIVRLQRLHQEVWGQNYVIPDARFAGSSIFRVMVSATGHMVSILRELPPEARAIYRAEFDIEAHSLFVEALRRRDLEELDRVTELYPLATIVPRAALVAGELFIEGYDLDRGRAVLERVAWEQVSEPRLRRRLASAWLLLAHLARDPELYARWAKRLTEVDPEARGGATVAAPPEAAAETDPQAPQASGVSLPTLPFERGRVAWIHEIMQRRFVYPRRPAPFSPVPAADDGWVALGTPSHLLRLDLRGRGLRQEAHEFPLPRGNRRYQDTNLRSRIYSAATAELVVTSYVAAANQYKEYIGWDIKKPVPRRALRAVRVRDVARGEADAGDTVLWDSSHARRGLISRLSFNSRAVVVGRRIYTLGWRQAGYVSCYLVCLDLHTGEQLWSTILADNQIELTMFGELSREPLLGDVIVESGVVYACTNLGVVAAVREWDGRVRWITEYSAIRPDMNLGRRAPNPNFKWSRNPMILHAGRLVVTPLDCHDCLVFDRDDGELQLVAKITRRHSRRIKKEDTVYMLGVHGDHLVFASRDTVTRVPVRDINLGRGYRRLKVDPDGGLGVGIDAPPLLVREGLLFATRDGVYLRSFVDEESPRLLAPCPDALPVRDRRRSRIRGAGAVSVVGDSILVTSSERITCYRGAPARPVDPEDRSER